MRPSVCLVSALGLAIAIAACSNPSGSRTTSRRSAPTPVERATPQHGVTVSGPIATPVPPAPPRLASPLYDVTTVAGTGDASFADGPGASAAFNGPTGLALAPDGALLVADHGNNAIRRVDLADPTHPVTTLAGASTGGAGAAGFADGDAASARFQGPMSLAAAADGRIFVADGGNHRIRLLEQGRVSTIAGTGNAMGQPGPGSSAGFVMPTGIALDGTTGLFVTDSQDNRVDCIDLKDGKYLVTSLAGNGGAGSDDGKGIAASFSAPFGVASDGHGNAVVADPGNHRLRKVAPDGTVTSLPLGPTLGDVIFQPTGVALRQDGAAIVTDVGNHRILAIPAGKPGDQPDTRLLAGKAEGRKDGGGTDASFDTPEAVVVAPDGTIYVADTANNQIRKLMPGTGTPPPATSPVPSGAATTGSPTPLLVLPTASANGHAAGF